MSGRAFNPEPGSVAVLIRLGADDSSRILRGLPVEVSTKDFPRRFPRYAYAMLGRGCGYAKGPAGSMELLVPPGRAFALLRVEYIDFRPDCPCEWRMSPIRLLSHTLSPAELGVDYPSGAEWRYVKIPK